MVGRDVVADDVSLRPPHQMSAVLGQEVAGAVQLRPVAHLEGNMMELGLRVIDEVDGVMVDAAAHEAEIIRVPVRHPEAHHVGVELHGLLHVVNAVRDVAELERRDGGLLAIVIGELIFGVELDHRTLDVGEHQSARGAGRNAVPRLALDAVLGQRARERRKVGLRRDLERQARQIDLVAALERDRFEPGAGGEECLVLAALGHDQAEHVGVVIHLPLEIGRGEGGVAGASDVDHGSFRPYF